ncbi:integrase family protein [Diaphorobacter sp. HDW4B]|uniref:tyrosine-type recombinase/integrase n=1 Tax=Diaphorobacter sp. HDW4B TaxID=2714925 RepID=UPI00140AA463|nr:integrase family protein [Diaphorobacter sp. HDW4B]QIL72890.1 integrase family protein [Diaphorobacter sp. HDW4B]
MFFDAKAAKGLQPGAHIVVQGCPGLRLEATLTKKTWTYRYRSPVDQKLRQIKIGTWPAKSPAQAAARWQELRDQRESGRDPAVEKRSSKTALVEVPKAETYTIGQLIEDYAEGYLNVNRAPKGAKAVAQRLRNALAGYAQKTVNTVTRSTVFEVIKGLLDRPVLAASVKSEMAAAWRFAMDAGIIQEDLPNWWAEKMSHKLRSKGAMRDGVHKGTGKRVLTGMEIKSLLSDNLGLFSQQVQDFLTVQLWTCTRGSEICILRKSQLTEEVDGLWWTVPKNLMKGRNVEAAHDLRIPLVGRAEMIVRRLCAVRGGDLLFPSVGRDGLTKPQTQAYMQSKVHYLQPYSKSRPDHIRTRLTVTHWSPHDLRRTGRTLLASLQCPHEVGEAIIGHVLAGVAGDYNLYRYDRERRHWLTELDKKLEDFVAASMPQCSQVAGVPNADG